MAQELENKIRNLRTELTQLVREGNDEDGLILRRLLAELERLENQRWALGHYAQGGSYVGMAV
jgi:hypothetical protein